MCTDREAVELLYILRDCGAVQPDEIIAWVDRQILKQKTPSKFLIDLSMAKTTPSQFAGEEGNTYIPLRLAFAYFGQRLRETPQRGPEIATLVARVYEGAAELIRAHGEDWASWNLMEDVRAQGSASEAHAFLSEFLDSYRPYEPLLPPDLPLLR